METGFLWNLDKKEDLFMHDILWPVDKEFLSMPKSAYACALNKEAAFEFRQNSQYSGDSLSKVNLQDISRQRLPSTEFLNAIKDAITLRFKRKDWASLEHSLDSSALLALGIVLQEYSRRRLLFELRHSKSAPPSSSSNKGRM